MSDLNKLTLSELYLLRHYIDEEKRRAVEMIHKENMYGKIMNITKTLGIQFHKNHGSYWVYIKPERYMEKLENIRDVDKLIQSAELVMIYDDYGANMEAYWRGKQVLDIHLGNVKRAVLGDWIDVVNKLFMRTIEVQRERERKALIEEITKEAEEWGIDLDELVKKVRGR